MNPVIVSVQAEPTSIVEIWGFLVILLLLQLLATLIYNGR
jgi:hypothetical protein